MNFISPGRPQKNGYMERFNRSFREDILNCCLFESPDEVREMAWQWQIEYNEQRSHDSLHNSTPVE
ncbi:MAG: integrase core domain-containing protein [Gammaproteobacteria bacterium]